MLNTALPAPVQAAPPVQAASPVQPRPPAQSQTLFQTPPPPSLLQNTPTILPQPTAATATAPTPKPVDTPPQITLQPASFAFSPGIVSCCCPHPGLIRDGSNLGPRVELMGGGKRRRTRPLNTALFQHISRDGSLGSLLLAAASLSIPDKGRDNLCQEGWANSPEPEPLDQPWRVG